MIVAVIAALLATPSCSAPVGTPVAVTFASLPPEALGGTYALTKTRDAPGEPRVGQLRYDWALLLRSDDPRFADFDLSPGKVHSRKSGCWFDWDETYLEGKVVAIANGRIGVSGYVEGYVPPQPEKIPSLPGYDFVAADSVRRQGHSWIGVWNAKGVVKQSKIVAFGNEQSVVLATLPVRIGAIARLPDLHSQAYHLTLVGEGSPGTSVPWMRLIWP